MIQKLFPPLGVVSQKLLHCAGQATELNGRNLAESFWVGRIKLCWLTATGCKRVLLLKKMGKKVRTTWADMVQFFWVNSACVYKEKYVHNLVLRCALQFIFWALLLSASSLRFPGIHVYSKENWFLAQTWIPSWIWYLMWPAAQAVNSSQDLSSLTLFKVYLNLLWLFVWSSQCLKKCFCLAQASGSLKLHRLKVVSFHGGAVVCEKDQWSVTGEWDVTSWDEVTS